MDENEHIEIEYPVEVIKAYLDGEDIQFKVYNKDKTIHKWCDYVGADRCVMSPMTHFYMEWRIKEK